MSRLSRRRFLGTTARSGAALSTFWIAGTKVSGKVFGANDRIRIAVCGIHGQGNGHLNAYSGMKDVEVACLVDPDSSLWDSRSKTVQERGGNTPQCLADVRKALEDPNIDAVSIATCNHWHSLMGIWACQAGKDVYVEKPLSHNVWEGRQLAEAARKYECIVQHGTQNRSSEGRAREIAAVRSGKYGKLVVSKGYCCKPRWSIGFKPRQKPPAHLDFDLWLGPAPQQDYHGNLVHYNWHWFWDTGNGDTGNQGVHEMDVARWAIPGATLPTRIWSLGGRFGYLDQGETPNMQLAVYEFGDVLLVFETRGLVDKHEGFPRKVGNEFYTTDGMIAGGQFYPSGGGAPEPVSGGDPDPLIPGGQFGSFIQAMRLRQGTNCDAEVGHYSSALCHLGNISYRLGADIPFQNPPSLLGDNAQVKESFEKLAANCRAVGMDLARSSCRLGRVLEMDPQSERFSGDEQANALLRRSYREPYVVPETV